MITQSATPVDCSAMGWRLENTYAQLPEVFYSPVLPRKVRAPRLVILNYRLAEELGLNLREQPEELLAAIFAGQTLPNGAMPIAQAYAGHQYGGFTMLGDGRAILLGEQRTPAGQLVDIQYKGSGTTPYSRRGDGRAALGPMLREYLISEAMHALGIPTTRSLAVVATGEPVFRESVLPGAVLTRVAASHLRVGTFQYAAALRDETHLRTLADYAIDRHYPELNDAPDKYAAFLRAVIDRQADLVARWQLVGFVHGVMNTDNMTISGETIDFGPCAFMDAYHPRTVFSSIDHGGRYAYGNQPAVAQWNLARFAETIVPLLHPNIDKAVEIATEALTAFADIFDRYWLTGMRRKLGLLTPQDDDADLIQALLDWMQTAGADFTNTFADLSCEPLPSLDLYQQPAFQAWYARWQQRLERESQSRESALALMQAVNPQVIPRNHRVEEALAAATRQDDLSLLHELLAVLATPFTRSANVAKYREPPSPSFCNGYRTFCGT